jgi:hypothetical protein
MIFLVGWKTGREVECLMEGTQAFCCCIFSSYSIAESFCLLHRLSTLLILKSRVLPTSWNRLGSGSAPVQESDTWRLTTLKTLMDVPELGRKIDAEFLELLEGGNLAV